MLQPIDLPSGPLFSGFEPGHMVQFYENDGFLAGVVVDFLAAGLAARQPAIVIAARPHREAFVAGLNAMGLDVDGLVAGGRLTLLDARETLASFMIGRMPDSRRFRRAIGSLLATSQLRGEYPCSRAYGEMVDLLWKDDNHEGAIRLEELWNDLAPHHSFALLCSSAIGNFDKEADSRQFLDVCRQHSHVVPTERFLHADTAGARLREITVLQQRAQALEHEVRRGRELELALRDALVREQQSRADAEQANRAKDEFLAVLSHELRTPLNAILGWTQIIKAGTTDDTTLARGLEVIGRNADLQSRLIDDLLDMSRIIRGQMHIARDIVDLSATVAATIESVRPAVLARCIDLEVQLEPSAVQVRGDAGRLHQIVWNLLSNAVKFTPPSGGVIVALERVGAAAQLTVRDTGQGIPLEFLPHVFDRFRQADNTPTRRHGGLGLGLAVVRHLVEAHGGTVSAESGGEGCGATFTVRLPLRQSRLPRSAGPADPHQE